MSFNTSSYFAGVGTVFVAVTLGFAGGYAISNSTQKQEPPNRLERVAANAPVPSPSSAEAAVPVAKPDKSAVPLPVATAEPAPSQAAPPQAAPPQTAPSPPIAAQQPPPAQEQAAQPPAAAAAPPVVARDDAAELAKIREADLKAAERKRAQRRKWAERQRHQQDLDAATAQVRQIDRGDGELVVQRGPMETPRFGFFGNDD